ncbi:MAG TPA: proteasome ATPase, partial [Acidimicrobiales bacterium]
MIATVDFDDTDGQRRAADEEDLETLRARALTAEEEVTVLRRRLQESPRRVQTLEEKLLETKGQLAQAVSQNEKLTFTLQTAKEHVANLRDEVEKLTQPPSAYGTYLGANDDGTVDVFSGGRKMRVSLHPDIDPSELRRGNEVVLNESLNVILAREGEGQGEVVVLKELLEGGTRALVFGRADEERVADLSDALIGTKLRAGDTILMESRTGLLIEKLARPEVEELVLEEVPDVTYADVGGLDDQIEAITDAVELPYLYRELYAEHKL